jgi:PAS domain-containing protein
MVHPDDRTKVASASGLEAYALDTETEIRIIQPAGNLRWLRMRNTVLFWPNGQPKTIMYIFVDITGQQQATEVLRQHEQLLDALAESFKIALFTKTQDGKTVLIHNWRGLGLSSATHYTDGGWLNEVVQEDRERVETHWRKSLEEKIPAIIRYRRKSILDDSILDLVFYSRPMLDSDGNVREWVGMSVLAHDRDADAPTSSHVKGLHIRAARALLDWSVETLAEHSGVSISTVRRFEGDTSFTPRHQTTILIRSTLEQNGVEFLTSNSGNVAVGLRG